jgi:uncharacterized protein (TIGR02246 family)
MHQTLQSYQRKYGGVAIALLLLISVMLMPNSALAQFSIQSNSEAIQMKANNIPTAEAIRVKIDRAKESWIQGDADAFAALFTAQGEFIVPGNRWVGPAAIRQVAADFATSSDHVTIDIHRVLVAGNQALVEWHWEDTEKSTGKRNRADDAIVIDFAGDQISRWREYIDSQTPDQDDK